MAAAATSAGYDYLAITDHSHGVGMGIGLEPDECLAHAEQIREHAATLLDGFHLLAGVEVDVMIDGDALLPGRRAGVARLGRGLGAPSQRLDRDRMTARLVAAASSPARRRDRPSVRAPDRHAAMPYDFDLEAVIAACLEHGTFLEINANPRRLDLAPPAARLAIEAGVGIVVSTDAHRTTTLDFMRYGVATARRAWATPAAIVNTLEWAEFAKRRKP